MLPSNIFKIIEYPERNQSQRQNSSSKSKYFHERSLFYGLLCISVLPFLPFHSSFLAILSILLFIQVIFSQSYPSVYLNNYNFFYLSIHLSAGPVPCWQRRWRTWRISWRATTASPPAPWTPYTRNIKLLIDWLINSY